MESHTLTPAGSISNKDITPAGTIGGHTLSVAELATHNHTPSTKGTNNGIWTYYHQLNASNGNGSAVITNWGNGITISNTGSSNSHNHTFTGTQNTHNHTFTGTAFSFDNNPPYKVAYCFYRVS